MTKKQSLWVKHWPFALSCPAARPAPDTWSRQGDSGVLLTVCNMRWWRKCEGERLRPDTSSSTHLGEHMTYWSASTWHCYCTSCIPIYTVIGRRLNSERWGFCSLTDSINYKIHSLSVVFSTLLLVYNYSSQSENSWLHMIIRKNISYFSAHAISIHWQSL